MTNIPQNFNPQIFPEYKKSFVEQSPSYARKDIGQSNWRTVSKPLGDKQILAHLAGEYVIATKAKWYLDYAMVDIDAGNPYHIKESLKLTNANALLFTGERGGHYYLMVKIGSYPTHPTKYKFASTVKNLPERLKIEGMEIYPQLRRHGRLPCSRLHKLIDPEIKIEGMERVNLHRIGRELTLEEHLHWLSKLEEFEIENWKYQLDFEYPKEEPERPQWCLNSDIDEIFNIGLQSFGTRHEAQFKILLYLWRKNYDPEVAYRMVKKWIDTKNNGFSKDYYKNPQLVYLHIKRQIQTIWEKYERYELLPDGIHNNLGFITKPDLEEIIMVGKGSLPLMKFAAQLISYANPRRNYERGIPIHSKIALEDWSKTRYQQFIQRFNVVDRDNQYIVGKRSRRIFFNDWKWKPKEAVIVADDRNVTEFKGAIRLTFTPEEYRECLKKAGVERTAQIKQVEYVFKENYRV